MIFNMLSFIWVVWNPRKKQHLADIKYIYSQNTGFLYSLWVHTNKMSMCNGEEPYQPQMVDISDIWWNFKLVTGFFCACLPVCQKHRYTERGSTKLCNDKCYCATAPCVYSTGVCPFGCLDGWKGDKCQIKRRKENCHPVLIDHHCQTLVRLKYTVCMSSHAIP